jgi:nucleotide-binding universal stress UspA family protein
MITLKRILAATDFSECSDRALRYACEFATAFDAELQLVSVIEPPATAYSEFGIGSLEAQGLQESMRQGVEAKLQALPEASFAGKRPVVRKILFGAPFVEIVRYARENEIDLIVLGTHGRGAIAHLLMGSTAERVVRKAPCPVLTVRPEAHEFVHP